MHFAKSCDFTFLCDCDTTARNFSTTGSRDDVSRFGNTDFPPLMGEWYDIFEAFCNDLGLAQIRNRLRIWLAHHGLIYINSLLYHRRATFYTILWKTHPFIGVGFKTDNVGFIANLLNRSLIKFQICIICTSRSPESEFSAVTYLILKNGI